MTCKYSAEWWQKYESMTARSSANSEKAEPARVSEMIDRGARPQSGEAGDRDRVVRRGSVAVLERNDTFRWTWAALKRRL
jgi:hypothetical protein